MKKKLVEVAPGVKGWRFVSSKSSKDYYNPSRCDTCRRVLGAGAGAVRWTCYICKSSNCYSCPMTSPTTFSNGLWVRSCMPCHNSGKRLNETGIIDLGIKLSFSHYNGRTLEDLFNGKSLREQNFVKRMARQSFANIEYQCKHTNKGSAFRVQVEIAKYLTTKYRKSGNARLRKQPEKYGTWTE